MRTDSQILRLALEKEDVDKHMRHFKFRCGANEAHFTGRLSTLSGESYLLDIELDVNYPDIKPRLYVSEPRVLPVYGNEGTLNSLGTSHAFHTLFNGPNDSVQICHCNPDEWHPGRTCVDVLRTGAMWLEAYEYHLRTSMTIDDYFNSDRG